MTYKLKTDLQVVYYMETKQCTIEDKNGIQHIIRVTEDSKGTSFIILNGNEWEDITDKELISWIIEDLPYEEIEK